MTDEQLPGFRGSAIYMSFCAQYHAGDGWSLGTWHRHDGEGALCSYSPTFDGLVLEELVDILVALLSDGNGRYRLDSDGCRPLRQVETPASSAPLSQ